jgi:hypothetical protein
VEVRTCNFTKDAAAIERAADYLKVPCYTRARAHTHTFLLLLERLSNSQRRAL